MVTLLSIEAASPAFGVPDANSARGESPALHGSEQGFPKDWRSLLEANGMAGNQSGVDTGDANRDSPSGAPRKEDAKGPHKSERMKHAIPAGEAGSKLGVQSRVAELDSVSWSPHAELAKPGIVELYPSLTLGSPTCAHGTQDIDQRRCDTPISFPIEPAISAEGEASNQYRQDTGSLAATNSLTGASRTPMLTEPPPQGRSNRLSAYEVTDAFSTIQGTSTASPERSSNGGNPIQGAGLIGPIPRMQSRRVTAQPGDCPRSTSADVTAATTLRGTNESNAGIQDARESARILDPSSKHSGPASKAPVTERANWLANTKADRNSIAIAIPEDSPSQHGQNDAQFLHSVSGAQGGIHTEEGAGSLSRTSGINGPSSVQQSFAALDGGDGGMATKWMHVGKGKAEAGFEDPTLGWVNVRAQVSSGGVHAIVVPSSSEAAQSLGGHLFGLSAYLSEHRTPVETLTIVSPDNHARQNAMEQSGEQQSGQGTGESLGREESVNGGKPTERSPSSTPTEEDGTPNMLQQPVAGGGMHVSVVA